MTALPLKKNLLCGKNDLAYQTPWFLYIPKKKKSARTFHISLHTIYVIQSTLLRWLFKAQGENKARKAPVFLWQVWSAWLFSTGEKKSSPGNGRNPDQVWHGKQIPEEKNSCINEASTLWFCNHSHVWRSTDFAVFLSLLFNPAQSRMNTYNYQWDVWEIPGRNCTTRHTTQLPVVTKYYKCLTEYWPEN